MVNVVEADNVELGGLFLVHDRVCQVFHVLFKSLHCLHTLWDLKERICLESFRLVGSLLLDAVPQYNTIWLRICLPRHH